MDDGSKYSKGMNRSRWTASSLHAAHAQQSTPRCVKNFRKWAKALIINHKALPCSRKGTACNCRIVDDNVAAEIATHLQSLGLWIRALDIVHYTNNPEVQARLKIKKTVSLATAHCWLVKMGYWWTKKPSGQYVDGHEHNNVVHYHQHVFLPAWAEINHQTRMWSADNQEIVNEALASGQILVVWFDDECTFYTNDQQIVQWVRKGETAVLQAKGEGTLLMVANFVSADYGWLTSADGAEST
jgi:hypothetical protein